MYAQDRLGIIFPICMHIEFRFVAPAAADWTLMQAAFPLSVVFLLQGVSASVVVTAFSQSYISFKLLG